MSIIKSIIKSAITTIKSLIKYTIASIIILAAILLISYIIAILTEQDKSQVFGKIMVFVIGAIPVYLLFFSHDKKEA